MIKSPLNVRVPRQTPKRLCDLTIDSNEPRRYTHDAYWPPKESIPANKKFTPVHFQKKPKFIYSYTKTRSISHFIPAGSSCVFLH